MRRPSPARVEPRCRKLAFETLESRDLLAADVGGDWWAEPSVSGSADDWSWSFEDLWTAGTGSDQTWDDGWWIDDVSWDDGSWFPTDDSDSAGASFDGSDQVAGGAGWVVEDAVVIPPDSTETTIDVIVTPADSEQTVVVVAPVVDAVVDQPLQIVDVDVTPPVATFDESETADEQVMPDLSTGSLDDSHDTMVIVDPIIVDPIVVDPIVVETVDDTDSSTSDATITDVPPETFDVDPVDSVFDAVVDGDATESWVIDATPIDEPSDERLPGSGTVDIREDIPVAATGIGFDPVPFRPAMVAGATPTYREATPLFRPTTAAAPAARFAGWGAFFMQPFGRAGGAFDGAALGGQADGQTGSGKPRIRLPFRPVV